MRVTKSLRTLPCLFSKVKLVSSSVCIISLISDIHWEKIGLLIRVTCPECLVYMWYICPPASPFSLDISSRPNPVGPSGRDIFQLFHRYIQPGITTNTFSWLYLPIQLIYPNIFMFTAFLGGIMVFQNHKQASISM